MVVEGGRKRSIEDGAGVQPPQRLTPTTLSDAYVAVNREPPRSVLPTLAHRLPASQGSHKTELGETKVPPTYQQRVE